MKRQSKGVRRCFKTEGKQEEAAKTVDVVLSSSLCRPVLSNTPKYTITSGGAWETSPNQHTPTECLTYLLLLTAQIFIISWAPLEHDILCLHWRQEIEKSWVFFFSLLNMRHESFLTVSFITSQCFPTYTAWSGDNTVARAQDKSVSSWHERWFKQQKTRTESSIFLSCLFVGDECKNKCSWWFWKPHFTWNIQ